MKYITKLEEENAELKKKIADAKIEIDDLTSYLNSKKFHCGDSLDGYVNVKDVLDRLKKIFL